MPSRFASRVRSPLGSVLICAAALAVVLPARLRAQAAFAPTILPWRTGWLDWRGPARPSGYIGVIGRQAAAFGTETGGFEVWTWPLKLLDDFELSFQTPLYPDPIRGRDVARSVEITPAGATITYTHSAFTVRQHIFAPLHEPAVVMVLEVEAVRPMEIVASFRADFQYAWPGGMGGQYIFWNDELKAFVLSESLRRHNGVIGSPFATSATVHPAHALPDAPSEIRIAVGDQTPVAMPRPGEPAGRLVNVISRGIPIVIVGQIAPRDTVLATYRRVLANLPALYAARAAHADSVVGGSLTLDPAGDTAQARLLAWAKLNLDEAMVCNPDLGCGPVAGYGAAGHGSYRPGFGWFFGGDAAVNSFALSAAGDFDLVKPWLAFFARYQRADGKIPHETSQSAGRLRWFEDYPYAFYHGDTTPFWLLAIGEYFRASADTAYLRSLWPNIVRAYAWSRSTDADGDGLMDNSRAGAGAIEVGDLGVGVRSDIYMSAVWVESLRQMQIMAAAVGDSATAGDAARRFPVARQALETKFWMGGSRRFAFAILENDSLNANLTVWPATAMSWHLFDEERGQAMSSALARATISTDWGGRALAAESDLFDPLHYNNGTVWPFVTGFLALAQYRYHNVYAAREQLDAVARTFEVWGMGRNPEVFSGASFEPLETAVPQQFFATSQYLNPLIRGAFGIEADAPRGVLTIAPHLFDDRRDSATWRLEGVRVGADVVDVTLTLRRPAPGARGPSAFAVDVTRRSGNRPLTIRFDPGLEPGSRIVSVASGAGGRENRTPPCEMRDTGRDIHPGCEFALPAGSARGSARITYDGGWRIVMPDSHLARGDRSSHIKVMDARMAAGQFEIRLEGPAGTHHALQIAGPSGRADTLQLDFPAGGDPRDGYVAMAWRLPSSGRFP